MSKKLNPEQLKITDEVIRLFNLKGRRLPDNDRLREWVDSVYKANLDPDILAEGVDALARTPNGNFTVGDLLHYCRGNQTRRNEDHERKERDGDREQDPQAKEVSRRCGKVFDLLPDGSGPLTPEDSLAMWRELKALADEMIKFYQDEKTREGGRALDQWKHERIIAMGKVVELEGRAGH